MCPKNSISDQDSIYPQQTANEFLKEIVSKLFQDKVLQLIYCFWNAGMTSCFPFAAHNAKNKLLATVANQGCCH